MSVACCLCFKPCELFILTLSASKVIVILIDLLINKRGYIDGAIKVLQRLYNFKCIRYFKVHINLNVRYNKVYIKSIIISPTDNWRRSGYRIIVS